MCVYVSEGMYAGTVWMNQVITGVYAAHGGTSPVCGRGVAGVFILERVYTGPTGAKPGCSTTKHLVRTREARQDGIRGQDHNERKKALQVDRGPTHTGNPPW